MIEKKSIKLFNTRSAKIMQHAMIAIIPPGGAFESGATDYHLLMRVEDILRSYNSTIRKLFFLILKYLEYETFLFTGKSFTDHSIESASSILEKMERSKFYYRRMMALMLKLITCLVFYEIDENAKQIGYEHGCHLKKQANKKKKKTMRKN